MKPEKFADYTLVSPEVEVKNFSVPYTEASDHLPMYVEFN
jgi:endonuclease/exonuclease/phosphatase family metal-dependent hydrolase